MKGGVTINQIAEFSKIFDEQPKDLNAYLTGISRSNLLKAMRFFPEFSNPNSNLKTTKEFFEMFFCAENSPYGNEVYSKIISYEQKINSQLIIISPQSCLQLFEFCYDNLTEEDIQTKEEAERNVFKALLFSNEENTKKELLSGYSTENLGPDIRLAAMQLSQSFPYSDIINYEITEVLACQIIKSVYLFEFLESNPNTKILLLKFLEQFNFKNWKDYLKGILPIQFSILNSNRKAHIDIYIPKDENFQNSCDFIEKLIMSDIEILKSYDFRKIRSKPFYKISDGVYGIIFPLFVVELIHKGLFFKLAEINKTLGKDEKVKGEFRSFYCNEFSERFLLYKTLNSIYKNRYIEFSGEEIKDNHRNFDAEPDYYIRNGNSLFLFESKDIFINAKIKPTYDFVQYEAEFKKKLYYEDKDGKIDNKAVLQLTKNIERALTKQLPFDSNYKVHSLYIYPILVLHDHQFNVTGLNVLVNQWFKDELEKLKAKGINIDKVQPITIINIDTFIFHQDLFRDRKIKLETVIDGYFKFIKFDPKRKYKDENECKKFILRTVVPFSNYLQNYIEDKKIRKVPKMLMDQGFKLFN